MQKWYLNTQWREIPVTSLYHWRASQKQLLPVWENWSFSNIRYKGFVFMQRTYLFLIDDNIDYVLIACLCIPNNPSFWSHISMPLTAVLMYTCVCDDQMQQIKISNNFFLLWSGNRTLVKTLLFVLVDRWSCKGIPSIIIVTIILKV